jgi:hypothetical protein
MNVPITVSRSDFGDPKSEKIYSVVSVVGVVRKGNDADNRSVAANCLRAIWADA